ncbi:MAG: hypothetical protein AAFS10_00975 [Myxococcota bacterium]
MNLQSPPPTADRRSTNRSNLAPEAMRLQLERVADVLELDVIVLADELGYPIAQAGDSELAKALANAAMWSPGSNDVDPLVWRHVTQLAPHLEPSNVVSCTLRLAGMTTDCQLLAIGRSKARTVGLLYAASGLDRIATQAVWPLG